MMQKMSSPFNWASKMLNAFLLKNVISWTFLVNKCLLTDGDRLRFDSACHGGSVQGLQSLLLLLLSHSSQLFFLVCGQWQTSLFFPCKTIWFARQLESHFFRKRKLLMSPSLWRQEPPQTARKGLHFQPSKLPWASWGRTWSTNDYDLACKKTWCLINKGQWKVRWLFMEEQGCSPRSGVTLIIRGLLFPLWRWQNMKHTGFELAEHLLYFVAVRVS